MAVTYPDKRALPVANQLLSCLCTAVLRNPKPPRECGFRVGETGDPLAGIQEDECCGGLAFLRLSRIYPSTNIPNQNPDPIICSLLWAAEFEMGIWRCVDVGTMMAPPTQQQWNEVNTDQLNDFASIRDALCCYYNWSQQTNQGPVVSIEEWAPKGDPEGGCYGSSITISIQLVGRGN